jgi:PKHD-type hydroxylase
MVGEWCYFKSYFDKQTCDKIIRDVQQIPSQNALVGVNNNDLLNVDSANRRSKVRFIHAGDWRFNYLFDELWKMAISANNDFFNVHITRLNFIQVAEYDASYQGEYKTHHDVFWVNGDPIYHRKLSCVIQLSDPTSYDGGDLEMVDLSTYPEADQIRKQGSALFFPSMFKHKANPVTRGTRYSIAAWFEGPKWR